MSSILVSTEPVKELLEAALSLLPGYSGLTPMIWEDGAEGKKYSRTPIGTYHADATGFRISNTKNFIGKRECNSLLDSLIQAQGHYNENYQRLKLRAVT